MITITKPVVAKAIVKAKPAAPAAPVASMTDAQLDAEFELSFVSNNVTRRVECVGEIGNRLMTVSSFLSGLFGGSKFPNYERRSLFVQSNAARSSVATSAGNLAQNAAQVVGGIFNKALLAVAVIGVVIYVAKKK
jgi:hypothetical protein